MNANQSRTAQPAAALVARIVTVRGPRAMIDADLAPLYGMTTKRLNEAGQTQPRAISFRVRVPAVGGGEGRGGRILRPPRQAALFANLGMQQPARAAYNYAMSVPFSWKFPYPWPRKPLFAKNVVCTSQPLAAQAGVSMLAAGGSAVDAILATAITLTLVEPVSNGIGSDAYAIVWDGKTLHGLNASGRSPSAWTPEYFAKEGRVPVRGWNSVSVPGCVSAWVELHRKFGKLPFEKLFEA